MGPKSESSCQQDVKEVINRALVVAGKQPFCTKKCNNGQGQVAQPVAGRMLNEVFCYLNPVNFETVEASKSYYPLCANMRRKIRKDLANRDKERTNLTAVIPDPGAGFVSRPGRPNPPGGVGVTAANINSDPPGLVTRPDLPGLVDGIMLKQEAAAEIAATTGESHDRRTVSYTHLTLPTTAIV